jgi:hypothetical protein
MFGFFRKNPTNSTAATPPNQKASASKPTPESDSDSGDDSNGYFFSLRLLTFLSHFICVHRQIDALIEVGGGKGWPTNATVLLYHKVQV